MDNTRQEDLWASVVSGGDPSLVFQAAEYDLDPVSTFIASFDILDRLVARLSAWDAAPCSLMSNGLKELPAVKVFRPKSADFTQFRWVDVNIWNSLTYP